MKTFIALVPVEIRAVDVNEATELLDGAIELIENSNFFPNVCFENGSDIEEDES